MSIKIAADKIDLDKWSGSDFTEIAQVDDRGDIEDAVQNLREFLEEEIEPRFERGDVLRVGSKHYLVLESSKDKDGATLVDRFIKYHANGFVELGPSYFLHDQTEKIDHIDL